VLAQCEEKLDTQIFDVISRIRFLILNFFNCNYITNLSLCLEAFRSILTLHTLMLIRNTFKVTQVNANVRSFFSDPYKTHNTISYIALCKFL